MQKMKMLCIATLVGVGGFVQAQGMADVVLDKKKGIYWQDNIDSQQSSEDWDDAVEYCDKLVLDGMMHWRLPSFNELLSIVDYRRMDPAVNSAFEFVQEGTYWTFTTFAPNVSRAWTIDFRTGKTYYSYKSTNHAVRCVKDVSDTTKKESK